MSLLFIAYLAFDDDTPVGMPLFSHDPCVWSLRDDFALMSCGDLAFFAALGYDRQHQFPQPLFDLRGLPAFIKTGQTFQEIDGEDYVGWLSATELNMAIEHHSLAENKLTKPVRVFLGAVRYLVSIFGPEHVRMIFVFVP